MTKGAACLILAAAIFSSVPGAAQTVRWPALNDGLISQALDRGRLKNSIRPEAQLVKYRVEEGPGSVYPESPPHLTRAQMKDLYKKLETIARGHGPLDDKPMQRLLVTLMRMDILYVNPISTKEWDSILRVAIDTARGDCPRTPRTSCDWNATVDHMLKAAAKELKDPHTEYLDSQETRRNRTWGTGSFVGIGVGFGPENSRGLTIEAVFPGSSAESAKIQAGDVLLSVNGKSLAGMSRGDAIKLLEGPENSAVSVEIIRDNQKFGPIALQRLKVKIPRILSKMLTDKIGYLYLDRFGDEDGADQDVFNRLRRLVRQGAESLVLDFRGNPGGNVSTIVSIASEFLKDGQEIVSFKRQGDLDEKYIADGNGEFSKISLVVLTDRGSASGSEIVAAAVQDWRKGLAVIGTRSFGKGSKQKLRFDKNGGSLHITTDRNYRPNGGSIDADHDPRDGQEIYGTGGVEPDIIIPVPDDQERKILDDIHKRMFHQPLMDPVGDPALDQAVEILSRRSS